VVVRSSVVDAAAPVGVNVVVPNADDTPCGSAAGIASDTGDLKPFSGASVTVKWEVPP
jgi:hypothetical protein